MAWFKRVTTGLTPQKKKELPEGLWNKCTECGEVLYQKELEKNLFVCSNCDNHFRITSGDYIKILSDGGTFKEFETKIRSVDPLKFKDSKKYTDRIKAATSKSGLNEAVVTGTCKINNITTVLAVMDFRFVGGSMGSVVGEKIARAIRKAIQIKAPLIIISASGGARMQEGALSLMQMAKTSAYLSKLSAEKLPFISLITHPTTGGVTASFSMLGDVNIAEPKALIGFAGKRVIKETIGQDLPDGFQTSEFLLERGFVDAIVHRHKLKEEITKILTFFPVKTH